MEIIQIDCGVNYRVNYTITHGTGRKVHSKRHRRKRKLIARLREGRREGGGGEEEREKGGEGRHRLGKMMRRVGWFSKLASGWRERTTGLVGEVGPVDFVYDRERARGGQRGGANQVLISRRGNFGGNRSTRLRSIPQPPNMPSLPRVRGIYSRLYACSIGPRSRSRSAWWNSRES